MAVKIGRPRKYGSPKALREAVEAYFASISYEEPVIVRTPTGEIDDDGHIKYQAKMLTEGTDGTGKPRTIVRYFEEPTTAGLYVHLGIDKSTWADYGKRHGYEKIVETARDIILARKVQNLNTRNSVQGIIFDLKANYGWKDRLEVTRVDGIEEYLARTEEEGEGDEL
jgi:hypothetical protein